MAYVTQAGHRYANAPIVEAILDIRVALPPGITVDQLATLLTAEDGYPNSQPALRVQGQFELVENDFVGRTSGEHVGYMFRRADQERFVQAHLDRFSFSWTGKYDTWSAFLAEAEAQWLRYRDVARPESVVGIGVRYVNRIPLPPRPVEIKDYLRTSVDLSPYLPQALSGLFMQVDIPLTRHGVMVTITSMLERPGDERPAGGLILDIDAKKEVHLLVQEDGFQEELLGVLATLRDAKNYVFEACITDATRGLID